MRRTRGLRYGGSSRVKDEGRPLRPPDRIRYHQGQRKPRTTPPRTAPAAAVQCACRFPDEDGRVAIRIGKRPLQGIVVGDYRDQPSQNQ